MKREVKIGIFAVLMIGALWAGIRFLKGFDLFSRNMVYYAVYDQVDGVQNASSVMIQGVKVGAVTDILFDPSTDHRVILQLTVKRQYRIPVDSEARIFSNSLMGSKAIGIELGTSDQFLEKGDTLRSVRGKDLMDMAGSELDFFKQKISQVTTDLNRTMNNLNTIMEQNTESIRGTMSHLNSISGNMDVLLATERENLQSAIANLTRFSEMLGENSPRIDSIVRNLNSVSDQIASADLIRNLDATLADLDAILVRVKSGEGTVGKLINDPALYESLNRSAENLASLLADLEAYPKRYVHFSLFGGGQKKVEKERARQAAEAQAAQDSLSMQPSAADVSSDSSESSDAEVNE